MKNNKKIKAPVKNGDKIGTVEIINNEGDKNFTGSNGELLDYIEAQFTK